MKNFHLPLPEQTYDQLRAVSAKTKIPATIIAREAIDEWLKRQLRQARHDAIAAYAKEVAGTEFDLDPLLLAASEEHLLATTVEPTFRKTSSKKSTRRTPK